MTMTPYAVAKKANVVLRREGLKEIPPQMVYNYCRKGLIEAYQNSEGKWQVTDANSTAWIDRYVAKRVALREFEAADIEGSELEISSGTLGDVTE